MIQFVLPSGHHQPSTNPTNPQPTLSWASPQVTTPLSIHTKQKTLTQQLEAAHKENAELVLSHHTILERVEEEYQVVVQGLVEQEHCSTKRLQKLQEKVRTVCLGGSQFCFNRGTCA